ncbi:hypothetical protein FRC10_006751, partial [Ceratobasidium sp. 414]
LTAVVNTPPEPTTTLSGTVRGHALYDTPSPNAGDATEPELDGVSSQHSASRHSSFGSIKNSQYNPTTIVKDNTRKIKDFFNRSKSSLASVTDERQSIQTIYTGGSSVSELSATSPATCLSRNAGHLATTSRGARKGNAGTGAQAGAADGRMGDTSADASAEMGTGARSHATASGGARPVTREPTTVPGTPGQDPEYYDLLSVNDTRHSLSVNDTSCELLSVDNADPDIIESLDPSTLAAHLAQYVNYDTSQLSTQDIKALLRAYLEDHTPSVAAPKQQTEVVVLSSSPIGVGGGYHANQARIAGSAKRPLSPQVAQASKRPKVTVEEESETESETESESESESETETETSDADADTIPESYDDILAARPSPHDQAPTHLNTFSSANLPSHHSASKSSHPAAQSSAGETTRQPTASTSNFTGHPSHVAPQAPSRTPSQQSTNPNATRHAPAPPPASASSATLKTRTDKSRATSPFSFITSHFGIPRTRSNVSQPTEREKEKRAQAKAAQRMLDLEAEPKPASRRGLRIPGRIRKKTAKLLAAVQAGYDKL